MHHLTQRMHSGVGSARAYRGHRLGCHVGKRPLQLCLHRARVGLNLPAVKRAAVVFDYERQTRTNEKRRRRFDSFGVVFGLRRCAGH